MACRIEDAGFEIRDMIAWVYGSGFPKSLDVSKAIDKAAGAEREVVGMKDNKGRCASNIACIGLNTNKDGDPITAPATDAAQQWKGWGTALKPALEPITMARKPLIGTVAENVLEHGTGAINVDGCRVEAGPDYEAAGFGPRYGHTSGNRAHGDSRPWIAQKIANGVAVKNSEPHTLGRWPANLIHDGSDEVTDLVGSAARFFYCAKASKTEREAGLEGMESIHRVNGNKWTDQDYRVTNGERPPTAESGPRTNHHPTVKPIDLMAYLCRLITPPSGTILDPFMGSGSTGVAALREGFRFIGIELNPEYAEIAEKRIENELNRVPLFTNA
jgi:site-specific DNA-methyltransferase (adenine-specific)